MLQAALTSIVFEATRQDTAFRQPTIAQGDGRLPRLSILWVYGAMVALLKGDRAASRPAIRANRAAPCCA